MKTIPNEDFKSFPMHTGLRAFQLALGIRRIWRVSDGTD